MSSVDAPLPSVTVGSSSGTQFSAASSPLNRVWIAGALASTAAAVVGFLLVLS